MSESELVQGVDLDELPVGADLDVETANTLYHIKNCGNGEVLISGNPDICPTPVPVNFHGSLRGTTSLKPHFIGPELSMEFLHPKRGIVRTSYVREVRLS
jgi:hypothetical protein